MLLLYKTTSDVAELNDTFASISRALKVFRIFTMAKTAPINIASETKVAIEITIQGVSEYVGSGGISVVVLGMGVVGKGMQSICVQKKLLITSFLLCDLFETGTFQVYLELAKTT